MLLIQLKCYYSIYLHIIEKLLTINSITNLIHNLYLFIDLL
jgi:hypothetical protein